MSRFGGGRDLPDAFGRPRRGPPLPPRDMDARRSSFGNDRERRRSFDDDDRHRGRDDRRRDDGGPPRWRESRDPRDGPDGASRNFEARTSSPPRGSREDEASPSDWALHLKTTSDAETKEGALKLAGVIFDAPAPVELTFWQALQEEDDEAILPLLDGPSGAGKLNERGGPYGSSPLGWAAFCGRAQLVQALLKRKADPSLAAEKGSAPLHMATWNGDFVEVVRLLLDAGADPLSKNGKGETALQVARKLDAIERGSPIEQTYKFEAWRAKYGKNGGAGRAGVIALLEAAQLKRELPKSQADAEAEPAATEPATEMATEMATEAAAGGSATEGGAAGGLEEGADGGEVPSETLEEAQAAEEAEAMDEVDALEALA